MNHAKPPQADILESISGTAPVARDRNGSTEDGQPRGGASGGSSLLPAG